MSKDKKETKPGQEQGHSALQRCRCQPSQEDADREGKRLNKENRKKKKKENK